MSAEDDAKRLILEERKRNYQMCFGSPAGQAVLIDFADFCRAAETCGVPGDRDKTFTLIGRNEVWLRIQNHMNLTSEMLFKLATGRAYITGEQTDE
jgi:hypothetical protein